MNIVKNDNGATLLRQQFHAGKFGDGEVMGIYIARITNYKSQHASTRFAPTDDEIISRLMVPSSSYKCRFQCSDNFQLQSWWISRTIPRGLSWELFTEGAIVGAIEEEKYQRDLVVCNGCCIDEGSGCEQ